MGKLELALEIAREVHKGQLDKAGEPYIEHPISVSKRCKSYSAKVVALLHDTIEDCEDAMTVVRTLRKCRAFLSEQEYDALLKLSRISEMTYFEYIDLLSRNKIAIEVKIADLEENLRFDRAPIPDSLRHRYQKAYKRLKEKQEFLK